jgi:LysR family transcriptional activator of nhaA
MDSLNYHHLRYFWMVVKEGGLARAAEAMHVSQPSISEQLRELENMIGEKLFQKEGRKNRLTDTGQIVYGYAQEIFALGREMLNAVKQRPGLKTLRLHVGIADSFPKLMTHEILKPVFSLPQSVQIICREGKMTDILSQLSAHRLDIVLADETPSSSTPFNIYSHLLGKTGTTFCAEKKLASRLKRRFPQSLHESPALLPSENTPFRRALEIWFREQKIQPQVVAEFEDLALMKVMASEGRGFIALPTLSSQSAFENFGFQTIGYAEKCETQFYAITADRRIAHPAVSLLLQSQRL